MPHTALLRFAFAAGLLAAAAPVAAQGARCTRDDLQNMAKSYTDAQTAGEPLKIPLAGWTQYTEQYEIGSMATGFLSTARKIDTQRVVLDLDACQALVESVITDPAHPYVLATRLQFSGRENPIAPSQVNEIETLITDKDDLNFDAARTQAEIKSENWGEIPAADRDTRQALAAAAQAYLDALPANLKPSDRPIDRRVVMDETTGTVATLFTAGPAKLPSLHLLRIEKGQVRYSHPIVVCKDGKCG